MGYNKSIFFLLKYQKYPPIIIKRQFMTISMNCSVSSHLVTGPKDSKRPTLMPPYMGLIETGPHHQAQPFYNELQAL